MVVDALASAPLSVCLKTRGTCESVKEVDPGGRVLVEQDHPQSQREFRKPLLQPRERQLRRPSQFSLFLLVPPELADDAASAQDLAHDLVLKITSLVLKQSCLMRVRFHG
jgi:hypothetical protein